MATISVNTQQPLLLFNNIDLRSKDFSFEQNMLLPHSPQPTCQPPSLQLHPQTSSQPPCKIKQTNPTLSQNESWLKKIFQKIREKLKLSKKSKEKDDINQQQITKEEQLRRDMGLSEEGQTQSKQQPQAKQSQGNDILNLNNATYDRNFLSPKLKSNTQCSTVDISVFEHSPDLLLAYTINNLHRQGDINCQKAYAEWEKEYSEINQLIKEKSELKNQTDRIEREHDKKINLINILVTATGAVLTGAAAFVSGGIAVPCIVGVVSTVGTILTKESSPVSELIYSLTGSESKSVIKLNKTKIEELSLIINQKQSKLSMIAQDISRLYQIQSSLLNVISSILQSRKECLSVIAGNIR